MAPSPRPLRLTVVLSGGASLGAYHAGVVAALVTARNALDDTSSLRIDAIGGASAGALVSLLGGWAVAAGRDPVWLLHEAWVERVDIDLLRGTDGRAPLDFDGLRDRFVELLAEAPRAAVAGAPIAVDVALTGLRGLTYPVRGLRGEDSIRASTYADWFTRRLGADADLAAVVDPAGASLLDAALASASNPGGFPPRLLDRSADRDVYAQHGIDPLPDPMTLWFSDGGLVLSEPVGRVVAAGADDAPGQRVAVLVDPRSEDPDGARSWSDPDLDPGWVDGLQRALAVLPAHEFYEDLRRLERDNARLQWVELLVDRLLPHLDDAATEDLRDALRRIAEEEATLRPADHQPDLEEPGEGLAGHLRTALAELAGVTGKQQVEADVISPLLLADDAGEGGAPRLLAGEILGDFGGFLDRELRASDFDLGWASAAAWLREGLARTDLDDAQVDAAVAAVDAAHHADWRSANRGDAGPRDLGWHARAGAARLALQLLRVTATELTGLEHLAPRPVRDVARHAGTLVRRVVPRRR